MKSVEANVHHDHRACYARNAQEIMSTVNRNFSNTAGMESTDYGPLAGMRYHCEYCEPPYAAVLVKQVDGKRSSLVLGNLGLASSSRRDAASFGASLLEASASSIFW